MKSHLSLLSAGLLVLPLALAACGSGSSGGALPKPTPAKSPNEPNAVPTKGTSEPKKVDTNNKSSDSIEKKVEPAPEPTRTIDPLQSIQGSYFSSEFYSGPISRSLVITGDKFVSKVRGNYFNALEVAEQTEEGSVLVAADGSVSLSVEKSSCDGRNSLVTSAAKLAKFTHLQAGEGSLEFKIPEGDAERAGSMKKVDALPEVVIEDGKTLVNACWYEFDEDVIAPQK